MTKSFFFVLPLCIFAVFATACSKKIDASSEEKLYASWTKVLESMPKDRQIEFDTALSTVWFYSMDDKETSAAIDGKNGYEIIEMAKGIEAAQPVLDTTNKAAFEASLKAMRSSLSEEKKASFDMWMKQVFTTSYRPNDPNFAAMNGLPFHKVVELGRSKIGPRQ